MNSWKNKARFATPSLVIASVAAAQGVSAENEFKLGESSGESEIAPLNIEKEKNILSTTNVVFCPIEGDRWEESDARRFDELARKEALAEISPSELFELDKLTQKRRFSQMEDSGEDIVVRVQRRRALNRAIQALEAYVRFVR